MRIRQLIRERSRESEIEPVAGRPASGPARTPTAAPMTSTAVDDNENYDLKLLPTGQANRSGRRRRGTSTGRSRPSDAYCQLRYSSCGPETSTARERFVQARWTYPGHRPHGATGRRRRRLDQPGPADVPGGRREADVTRVLDTLRRRWTRSD